MISLVVDWRYVFDDEMERERIRKMLRAVEGFCGVQVLTYCSNVQSVKSPVQCRANVVLPRFLLAVAELLTARNYPSFFVLLSIVIASRSGDPYGF